MQTNTHWNCGVSRLMDSISGKWKLNIIWIISQHEPIRFNQLKREVEGITKTMLTRALNDLIADGLVLKTDLQTLPFHTQYCLTAKGQELLKLLLKLNTWGKDNM